MQVRKSVGAVAAAVALLLTSAAAAAAAPSTDTPPTPGPTVVPSELEVGDILPESDGTISVTNGLTGASADPASAALNADADETIISPLYTRTWAFTGDFKASLQSSKFDNSNTGEIRVGGVNVTNCTSGYGSINIQLIRVNTLNVITWTGSNVNFPCNGSYGYSWGSQPNAGYKLYFSRTGPTGTDENTKHVTGTVYYA
jgi:hypothetical protein